MLNKYRQVKHPINSTLFTVQSKEFQWGVVNSDDSIVVPLGKYAWIDGFQNGLAKVISHEDTSSPNIVAIIGLDASDSLPKRITAQES